MHAGARTISSTVIFAVIIVLYLIRLAGAEAIYLTEKPIGQAEQRSRSLAPAKGIAVFTFKIINEYPHDQQAFTQGLVFDGGVLYEGTGLRGQSTLRRTVLETGAVLQVISLSEQYFGEGITVWRDEVIQLTWKSRTGFVYDKDSFKLRRTFRYPSEGWGITHDGNSLIMSDGTANLYFLDPETFSEIRRLKVYSSQGPVKGINELEYIKGKIFANIWPTNRIVIISPHTGRVTGYIDLESLSRLSGGNKNLKTLNGIAYDAKNDRLFVTGKLWPKIYEIELIPVSP